MPRHVRWHRIRVGLVVALAVILAGMVTDSLLSASWALDDGLLVAAAAVIGLALLLTRGRGEMSEDAPVAVDFPRLEHVRVNVSDFARAVAWYEEILGLPAQSHWPPEAPKYAHFQTGSTQFAISELDPVPAAGRYNFSVRDVDAWWEQLRDRAEVIEPLFDTPYGTRKFTVCDPDGNELGFVRED
jgi:predicted enzyme related to lactoylglutathione lyase